MDLDHSNSEYNPLKDEIILAKLKFYGMEWSTYSISFHSIYINVLCG